ncbi:MAG: glycosyltransferase [Bacillota bacterium]
MQIAVCTIASKNYLSFVRTLMQSLETYHPNIPRFLLLVDRIDGFFESSHENFTVIEIESLPNIPDLKSFLFQYNVLELNTAVKPYLLEYLLEKYQFDGVIYFDPDILVTNSLEPLLDLLRSVSIVLTPHILSPLPDDNKLPGDVEILRAGTYNLGFIAIRNTPNVKKFLKWWQEKLYRWCRARPDWGVFVDQRWIDMVPGLVQDVKILHDPTYNVAYWNLHERQNLDFSDGNYYLNGQPLRFFHFSGIEIENPERVSKHQNRFTLEELGPAYRKLFQEYIDQVIANGYYETKDWPYAFKKGKDGRPIQDQERAIYWEKVHRKAISSSIEEVESQLPPHIVAYNYLKEGNIRRARYYYWRSLIAKPYNPKNWFRLLISFLPPCLAQTIRRIWEHRYKLYGLLQKGNIPVRKYRTVHTTGGTKPTKPFKLSKEWGVNVAAYIDTESGVGQGGRNLIKALKISAIPYALNNIEQKWLRRKDKTFLPEVSAKNPYPVNIIVVNADQVEAFANQVGAGYFNNKYSIGYWFWEVFPFPEKFKKAFLYYNEIWVGSTYVLDIISRQAPIPAVRVPFAVDFPLAPLQKYTRQYYGLDEDKFTFLYVFDGASYFQRKNPVGLVEAFKVALPRLGSDCQLILKVTNPQFQPSEYEKLVQQCKGLPVRLIEGYLSREETLGLINCCNCYVSPHRAEGFGLTIAEAMYLEKPVIATGYSGNMDFMNVDNSYIIPYQLVTLEQPVGPYETGSIWADPDIEYTAKLMIEIYEDRDTAIKKGKKAADWIRKHYSNEAVAALLKARLEVIKAYLES